MGSLTIENEKKTESIGKYADHQPCNVAMGSVQLLICKRRTFLRKPLFFIEKYFGTG